MLPFLWCHHRYPPPPSHVFVEPKDTTGQAVLLRRVRLTLTTSTVVRTADASSVSSTPPLAVREEVQTFVIAAVTEEHNTLRSNDQVSRTQKWHLLKSSQGEYDQGTPTPKRSLMVYRCGECGKV